MMRFGFITCVELGRACIEEIYDVGGQLDWLGTLHDDLARQKSGRVYLDDIAAAQGVPLSKFRNVNDEDALKAIAEADLDWLFIIGWSQIAREPVLNSTRRGVLGMHPTLLPEGRGRASIPWAIIKGLSRTGVSMFQLDEGTDTGPIVSQVEVPITDDETSTTLYAKVADAHRTLIRETWPALVADTVVLTPQDHSRATEWPGRRPEDGYFDPATMTTAEVDRFVRALTRPYPGAYTQVGPTTRLRVWAGHPGARSDQGGSASPLQTADGWYVVTESDLESST